MIYFCRYVWKNGWRILRGKITSVMRSVLVKGNVGSSKRDVIIDKLAGYKIFGKNEKYLHGVSDAGTSFNLGQECMVLIKRVGIEV